MQKDKRKLRVQKLNKDGAIIEDRLVTAMPEYYKGPTEAFPDGCKLEFEIGDSDDAERAIAYIKQLAGMVPLNVVKRGRKPTTQQQVDNIVEMSDTQRKELIAAVISKKDQDKFLKTLRELDFRFLSSDFIKQLGLKIGDNPETEIGVSRKQYKMYSWMLRTMRLAKDPANDKYDPRIVFGVKLFDGRSPRIKVYLDMEVYRTIKVPVPEKPKYNIKKVSAVKYPPYMSYEDRAKWRKHHRDFENGKPATKFHEKWTPLIDLGEGTKVYD